MFKNTLLAISLTTLSFGAVGCTEDPAVDPDIMRDLPPGMEVVVVTPQSDEAAEEWDTAYLDRIDKERFLEESRPLLDPSLGEQRVGPVADNGSDGTVGGSGIPPQQYHPAESVRDRLSGSGDYRPADDLTDLPNAEYHPVGEEASSPDSDDPCTCDGPECMSDWVENHLGCNVCAVFVCGDDYTPHACNTCP